MPEYKQGKIVEELLRRIREGVYAERLPLSQDLAQEFSVNFKTINKALNQLVADGILFRKKGCGTFLRTPVNIDGARMVEVLFEGYTTVSSHPFWGEIWSGVIKTLSANGYRPVLSMVTAMLDKAFETIPDGTGLILHSDQGWQYQHKQYQRMLKRKGIRQSMSRKGNCLDNAVMENFFGLLKSELLYLQEFNSMEHFKQELADYLDYYNNRRIKAKLKGLPPAIFRQQALSVSCTNSS